MKYENKSTNRVIELNINRDREERLAVLNAQHQAHIVELQKKIQQKVHFELIFSSPVRRTILPA